MPEKAAPAAAPAAATAAALGNRTLAALAAAAPGAALARAVAGGRIGNRAAAAMIQRELPRSTADLHQQVYGDSALAHGPSGPPPEPYEFSDDPLADGGFGPDDDTIRVKPGPVRTTFIKPKPLTPSGEWLGEALQRDQLLQEPPRRAREKGIEAPKGPRGRIA